MTRALRSPNTPRSIARGWKPGNRYASARRFGFGEVGIEISCQISAPLKTAETQHPRVFQADRPLKSPTLFREDPKIYHFQTANIKRLSERR
jgi:hypothetical protein